MTFPCASPAAVSAAAAIFSCASTSRFLPACLRIISITFSAALDPLDTNVLAWLLVRSAISPAKRGLNAETGSSSMRARTVANLGFRGLMPLKYRFTAAGVIPASSAIFFWLSFSSFFFERNNSCAAEHSASSSGGRIRFLVIARMYTNG
ncbi:hypothetical protein D3C84_992400 [compost metagenome]